MAVERRLGLKWRRIAYDLGVTIDELYMWRKRTQFMDPLQPISDDELLPLVKDYCNGYPDGRGQNSVEGYLLRLHLKVTRQQLQRVLQSDEQLAFQRKQRGYRPYKMIRINNYISDGPGECHHADCNLKLGHWGFSIFGVIDGYSHELMLLDVTFDRKAATILQTYVATPTALARGLPQKFRIDCGSENMAVARFLHQVGVNVIPGASPRNVRIERHWKDVMKDVLSFYRILFKLYERPVRAGGKGLNATDPEHIWLLQYLFGPRLRAQLHDFRDNWNCHRQRLTKSYTPLQLVHLAHRSFYQPIVGTPIHDVAAAAFESLEEEYIGKGKCAKNKSPFISAAEYGMFAAAVTPLTSNDDERAFDAALSNAINTINEVKALRN